MLATPSGHFGTEYHVGECGTKARFPFLLRRKKRRVQTHPDRRERKKRAIREALEDAAFRLFDERGFAETTIEQIADEADVSRSTFFRYFGSKESVLFGVYDENGRILAELVLERPRNESPLVAFENALVDFVAVPGLARGPADTNRFRRILESTPALKAKSVELTMQWRGDVAHTFARREGLAQPTREHLLAAAVGMAVAERLREEYVDPAMTDDLEELIRSQFQLLRKLASPADPG